MTPSTTRSLLTASLFSLCFCCQAVRIHAAPNIQNVVPRGLQIGQPTLLTIEGSQLGEASQLMLDVPLASQVVKAAAGNQLQIEVTVDPMATPGIYALRLTDSAGISNAISIGIDAIPQQRVVEEIDNRPVALSGSVTGGQIQRMRFQGNADERVVIDIESRRLGAQLRPVLRLYDPRGTQIAWSARRREIGGDARIEAKLPQSGQYTIELHDVVYKGANPGFYRIKIGDLHAADFAMPAGVRLGEQARVELYSSALPDGPLSTEINASGASPGAAAATLPANVATLTGGQPLLMISDLVELSEQGGADGIQTLPAAPVAITGRLVAAKEEDQYQLVVTPGSKLRVELFAARLGAPLDAVLMIRNPQGGQLARGDDQANTADPLLEYTVPANVEQLVVAVKDLVDRGGESFFYRLVVQDAATPDFSLTLDSDRQNIPAGGTRIVRVDAARRGYDGPIQLAVDSLPDDWKVAGDVIGAGQSIGLLSLTAPSDASTHAVGRVIGRAPHETREVVRAATAPEQPFSQAHPWMRTQLALGSAPAGPLTVAWTNAKDEDRLPLGGSLSTTLSITRMENLAGKVRVRLLTTQTPLKKKGKQDNKDVEVDDVDRMLRLESEPVLDMDAKEATVKILVPADLPAGDWGVSVVAELLSADEKKVAQTAATPVRRLATAKE